MAAPRKISGQDTGTTEGPVPTGAPRPGGLAMLTTRHPVDFAYPLADVEVL